LALLTVRARVGESEETKAAMRANEGIVVGSVGQRCVTAGVKKLGIQSLHHFATTFELIQTFTGDRLQRNPTYSSRGIYAISKHPCVEYLTLPLQVEHWTMGWIPALNCTNRRRSTPRPLLPKVHVRLKLVRVKNPRWYERLVVNESRG
jgi:hypothetical protein